jgi:hypothetical protein
MTIISDEILYTLKKKCPIYTNKLTDNYKIVSIIKTIVDANTFDFIIETDRNIEIQQENQCYRNIKVGDAVCLSNIKYQFKLSKIKKDESNLYSYRNQTTITANNIIKFYNGNEIEISNVVTDTAYNGIHELLQIDNQALIFPSDKIFKININPAINIITNEINNEGYYNLKFWNSAQVYGSLNDYHEVKEIISNTSFRIRIQKNNSIDKYFFTNDYDNLDLTEAEVRANPRIANYATEEKAKEIIEKQFEESNNNWLIITFKEISHGSQGISTEDQSIYFNQGFRLQRDYIINIRLYSNTGTEETSDYDFILLQDNIQIAINISLLNQYITTSFLENNNFSYLILPLQFSQPIRETRTLIYQDFPFKITTMINSDDLQQVKEFEVPLQEFDLKFYADNIEDEGFNVSNNLLQ